MATRETPEAMICDIQRMLDGYVPTQEERRRWTQAVDSDLQPIPWSRADWLAVLRRTAWVLAVLAVVTVCCQGCERTRHKECRPPFVLHRYAHSACWWDTECRLPKTHTETTR